MTLGTYGCILFFNKRRVPCTAPHFICRFISVFLCSVNQVVAKSYLPPQEARYFVWHFLENIFVLWSKTVPLMILFSCLLATRFEVSVFPTIFLAQACLFHLAQCGSAGSLGPPVDAGRKGFCPQVIGTSRRRRGE